MHPEMHLPGHGGVITPRAPLTLGVGAEPVKQRNISGAPKARHERRPLVKYSQYGGGLLG